MSLKKPQIKTACPLPEVKSFTTWEKEKQGCEISFVVVYHYRAGWCSIAHSVDPVFSGCRIKNYHKLAFASDWSCREDHPQGGQVVPILHEKSLFSSLVSPL